MRKSTETEEFAKITSIAIIYIYVLFIALHIGFIFNLFYCYYIIIKVYCCFLRLREILHLKKQKKKKWLKNVGGKADSLPRSISLFLLF